MVNINGINNGNNFNNLSSINDLGTSHPNNSPYDLPLEQFCYSNFDIKNKEGTVVFQKAPYKVEQVTIPKLETVQEIPQMMSKVLDLIIPIGLIIFGIGLVIYLTRLVISRMT